MTDTPTNEPLEIRAGDTWKWRREDLTDYPAGTWSLTYRFVNASTVDGFNPYRLTRDGVDWESVSPNDPWSNISYWGDHQVISHDRK